MSKKISQKQIDANKRNAQKSTGPRTKEGKTKSAMNSIKYGIYSKKYLIKDESPEEFDNYRKSVLKCLKPNNFVLFDIANQIISNGWEYPISWLDSPELEEKYEAIREYNKNAPDDLEEKQKYLADYKLDKALSALRAKKVDQQEIKKEDPEVIINHENNNKEYAEGLPDDLWNINSLYKVNVIAKRHYANYHRGIHSYFEIKNKFNNLIDI